MSMMTAGERAEQRRLERMLAAWKVHNYNPDADADAEQRRFVQPRRKAPKRPRGEPTPPMSGNEMYDRWLAYHGRQCNRQTARIATQRGISEA